MRARRLLALIVIFAWGYSLGETVVGSIGDGAIHHETVSSAALHGNAVGGDHGHEDGGEPAHRHDGNHKHGTAADHCTHHHGAAAINLAWAFRVPRVYASAVTIDPFHLTTQDGHAFFHPPRA